MRARILVVAFVSWAVFQGCTADNGNSDVGPLDSGTGAVDAGAIDPGAFVNTKALAFSDVVTAMTTAEDGTVYLAGRFEHAGSLTGGGVPVSAEDAQPRDHFPMATQVSAATSDGSGGWYVAARFMVEREFIYGLAHITADGELDAEPMPIDGIVHVIVLHDDKIYIGGEFTSVGQQRRYSLAAASVDGTVLAWSPHVDRELGAEVRAMLIHQGILYVGGVFDRVDGEAVTSLIAFDLGEGRRAWQPVLAAGMQSPAVFALSTDGDQLYVGGGFESVDGQPRVGLAAFDRDGRLTAWAPSLDGIVPGVSAMVFHKGVLYVSGTFMQVDGQDRSGLAAFHTDGGLSAWAPALSDGWVARMAAVDGTIYIGGRFRAIAGQPRLNVAAISAAGALLSWDVNLMPEREGCFVIRPCLNMHVSAVSADERSVYVGGNFRGMGNVVARSGLAAVDATGRLYSWMPHDAIVGRYISAVSASSNAIFAATINSGISYDGAPELVAFDRWSGALLWRRTVTGEVQTLAVDGETVYAGGSFDAIDGSPRRNLAALSSAGDLLAWAPRVDASGEDAPLVRAIVVVDNTVYVGGRFDTVDGQARLALAAVATDGTMQPWRPIVGYESSSWVSAIAIRNDIVYVSGDFVPGDGQPRRLLAAIDSDGAVLPWRPDLQGLESVGRSMVAGEAVVYMTAQSSGAPTRTELVAFDMAGTRLSWPDVSDWESIYAMTIVPSKDGSTPHVLFVGGQAPFSRFIGGGYLALIDENGGFVDRP